MAHQKKEKMRENWKGKDEKESKLKLKKLRKEKRRKMDEELCVMKIEDVKYCFRLSSYGVM
jgi:hypothetical protein